MSQAAAPMRIDPPAPRRQLDGRFQHTYRRAAEEALIFLETRGVRLLQVLQEAMAQARAEGDGEAKMLMGDHLLSRRAAIEELNQQLELARRTRDHLEFTLRRRMDEMLAQVATVADEWNAFLASSAALAAIGGRQAAALDALGKEAWHTAQKLEALCQSDPAWAMRKRVEHEETLALCVHLRRVLGPFGGQPEELRRVGNIMRSAVRMMGDKAFLVEVRQRVYIKEGDRQRVHVYAPILEVPGVVCRFKGLWWKVWAWVGEPRRLPWLSEDFVAVVRHAIHRLDQGALANGELALSSDFVDSVAGLVEPLPIRQARQELARAKEALQAARAETPEVALRILM